MADNGAAQCRRRAIIEANRSRFGVRINRQRQKSLAHAADVNYLGAEWLVSGDCRVHIERRLRAGCLVAVNADVEAVFLCGNQALPPGPVVPIDGTIPQNCHPDAVKGLASLRWPEMAPVKVRSSTKPAEAGEADGEEGGVGLGEALPVGEPEQAGSDADRRDYRQTPENPPRHLNEPPVGGFGEIVAPKGAERLAYGGFRTEGFWELVLIMAGYRHRGAATAAKCPRVRSIRNLWSILCASSTA